MAMDNNQELAKLLARELSWVRTLLAQSGQTEDKIVRCQIAIKAFSWCLQELMGSETSQNWLQSLWMDLPHAEHFRVDGSAHVH